MHIWKLYVRMHLTQMKAAPELWVHLTLREGAKLPNLVSRCNSGAPGARYAFPDPPNAPDHSLLPSIPENQHQHQLPVLVVQPGEVSGPLAYIRKDIQPPRFNYHKLHHHGGKVQVTSSELPDVNPTTYLNTIESYD